MTGSSSKLLQIQGKMYQERKPKQIQNLRQKKYQKLFYTFSKRLIWSYTVWSHANSTSGIQAHLFQLHGWLSAEVKTPDRLGPAQWEILKERRYTNR